MRSTRGTGVRSTAVAAVAVLALSACGSGSDDADSSESRESTAQEGQEEDQEEGDVELVSQGSESDSQETNYGSPLQAVTVDGGEDSDTVRLTFEDDIPDLLADYYVNPVYQGGDYPDRTHDVEGHWFLNIAFPGQAEAADEVVTDIEFDGDRVVHYFPTSTFEGTLRAVIGINSENGLMPEYEITTDGSDLLIEISDGAYDS